MYAENYLKLLNIHLVLEGESLMHIILITPVRSVGGLSC